MSHCIAKRNRYAHGFGSKKVICACEPTKVDLKYPLLISVAKPVPWNVEHLTKLESLLYNELR